MTRELEVQYEVRTFLEALGCAVYALSQGRATRQSPGLPDLWVLHPRLGGVWIEVKAPGGRRSHAQAVFAERCAQAHVPHLFAPSLEPVRRLCEAAGLLAPSSAGD